MDGIRRSHQQAVGGAGNGRQIGRDAVASVQKYGGGSGADREVEIRAHILRGPDADGGGAAGAVVQLGVDQRRRNQQQRNRLPVDEQATVAQNRRQRRSARGDGRGAEVAAKNRNQA